MKLRFILPLLLLTIFSIDLQAQFNPARRAMERAADKAAEKMTDKAAREMEDMFERETRTERDTLNQRANRALDALAEDVEVRESYEFQLTLHIEGHTTTKKGKEKDPYQINWLLNKDAQYQGMETFDEKKQAAFIIYDFDKNGVLTFTDNKEVMVMSTKAFGNVYDKAAQQGNDYEDPSVKVQATGKKRTIAGYSCEQYIFSSNDSEGEMWITRELEHSPLTMFAAMNQKGGQNNPWSGEMAGGFPLESRSTDLQSGDTHFMTTTKVDKTSRTYRMSDYKVNNLSNMMRGN